MRPQLPPLALLVAFAIVLACGCVEVQDCRHCDDGNPCTVDDCGTDAEQPCVHWPQDGPQPGCNETLPGCSQRSCVDGACLTVNRSRCCGNGRCEAGEGTYACPQDCPPSCSDFIQNQGEAGIDCGGLCERPCPSCNDSQKNQGEEGVDCGGPCPTPCTSNASASFESLHDLYGDYTGIASSFNDAISRFNGDGNANALSAAARSAAADLAALRGRLSGTPFPRGSASLRTSFAEVIDTHIDAAQAMRDYAKTRRDSFRQAANRLLSDASAADARFVAAYNQAVESENTRVRQCADGIRNQGEQAVDCGGPCLEPCTREVAVSKVVVVTNDGRLALDVFLNVTPAGIDYPPFQKILGTTYSIQPDHVVRDVEGNVFYQYAFPLAVGQSLELSITQRLRLSRGERFHADPDPAFLDQFLALDDALPPGVCETANTMASSSAGIHDTADLFFAWIHDNIAYRQNRQELGAAHTFQTRQGACDEHADLFVAFSRCTGTPARRVTGFLENESRLTGHAWSEYYGTATGGWYYLEPTVRGSAVAHRSSDGRHVISCVGKRAYRCGTSYAYTYLQGRDAGPGLSVTEEVVLLPLGI